MEKRLAFLMMKQALFLIFFNFIHENKHFHQRHCMNFILEVLGLSEMILLFATKKTSNDLLLREEIFSVWIW
jgi:hypothetical protein